MKFFCKHQHPYPLILFFAVLAHFGCVTDVPGPQDVVVPGNTPQQSFDQVLKTCVDRKGRVDFRKVDDDGKKPLHHYLSYIAKYSPMSHPAKFPTRNHKLAFHINAYNALAMHGVIAAGYPKDFDSFTKRLGFFKLRSYVLGGERWNLFDYENDVIRGMGDPRIHFALNCMSVGCPRLPQEIFTPGKLDKQLDDAAKEFFNSTTYVQIDRGKKIARLSEILDFFTEDFVNAQQSPSLIAYVNRYRQEKIPQDYEVEFIPYDWTVNKQ